MRLPHHSWPSSAGPNAKKLLNSSINLCPLPSIHRWKREPKNIKNTKIFFKTRKSQEKHAQLTRASRRYRLMSIRNDAKSTFQIFRNEWTKFLTARTNFGCNSPSKKTHMKLVSPLAASVIPSRRHCPSQIQLSIWSLKRPLQLFQKVFSTLFLKQLKPKNPSASPHSWRLSTRIAHERIIRCSTPFSSDFISVQFILKLGWYTYLYNFQEINLDRVAHPPYI